MKNGKRMIVLFFFLPFLFTACKKENSQTDIPMMFSGSASFENYDVGNKKDPAVLSGRSESVCIPTLSDVPGESEDISYLVYCTSNNKVITEHRSTKRIYPASITKLMTTYIALKYCDLNEMVTFSHNASHIGIKGAALCGFQEGDSLTLGDLLEAMLISSGNDASIAIAEHVSGTVEAFVEKMNQEALQLGAVDTHFVNPHGLHSDEQYSTAYDMYLVFNELIHYNRFVSAIAETSLTVNYKDAAGNNKAKAFNSTNLFFSGAYEPPDGITLLGGKTGYTEKAQCCLILSFEDRDGNSYVAELFHSPGYEALYNKIISLLRIVAE